MVQIVLNEEQAQQIRQAGADNVQLCDAAGKLLALIEPHAIIAELKRRAAGPGPWFTGQQVQNRLKALEQEWERTGGFDEKYMREYLKKLNAQDPGHYRKREEG